MSASVSVPADTSSVLPEPTVMFEVAIVVPSIVPPLISAVVSTEEAIVKIPVLSAIDAEAVPSLALILVISKLTDSTVPAK